MTDDPGIQSNEASAQAKLDELSPILRDRGHHSCGLSDDFGWGDKSHATNGKGSMSICI